MGYYNRAAIVATPGMVPGRKDRPATLEEVHRHFHEIDDLGGAREHQDATTALGAMLTAADKAQ